MASRREFIQAGIVASALPMIGSAGHPAAPPAAPAFYKAIFDHRFPASVEFGRQMERLGESVHGIHGDITDLWYHDLYHRWKQGPAAITGMTAHGALFCLERLAWDHGMRVLSRTEHPAAGGEEPLITWTIGPKPRGTA
jgi:hypothetical protein